MGLPVTCSRCCWACGVSLNELFLYQSDYISSDQNRGTYQVQTRNDMFGPQVGVDLVENYTNWSWGGRFKAGSLYNFADRRSKLDTLAAGDAFYNYQEIDKDNLTILLEGGLMATYQVRAICQSGWPTTRCGYRASRSHPTTCGSPRFFRSSKSPAMHSSTVSRPGLKCCGKVPDHMVGRCEATS